MAETKAEVDKAFDFFAQAYGAKHEKAAACLTKDPDRLLTFYDFPAEHWKHMRSTNPIEREHLRHGSAQDHQDQGLSLTQDGAGHGLQAALERPQEMAQAQRLG